jgi:hypothetical protein
VYAADRTVITTLAFRHLLVRKRRSLFLLLGYSLGVGVMIVLLSIGQALLEQSRDASLIGGGEVTVLPQGIDVEAMRTGGVSGMFFGIDRARYITRQAVGGPRHRDLVRTVSPGLEGKLIYLRHRDRTVTVRAGGEIPSRARAVGSGLNVLLGSWDDSPADSAYIVPTAQQLFDQLDRFHLPPKSDSSWAEWHYFNLAVSPDEWWYVTYLLGGEVELRSGESARTAARDESEPGWGGQLLITRRRPDGKYQRFSTRVRPARIVWDTLHADLRLGESSVYQRDGRYRLQARAAGIEGLARLDVVVTPAPNRYFPPVELGEGDFVSGYVVPALVATGTGMVCVGNRCRSFSQAPAYHDHNWGTWRDVSWEWGMAQGEDLSILYGGVYGPSQQAGDPHTAIRSPFFLTAVDSLGVKQVLRFERIDYQGSRPVAGAASASSPERFTLFATRDRDSLQLEVSIKDALGTELAAGPVQRVFLQMRGRFSLRGHLLGEVVADSGMGFFETYVPKRPTQ